MAELRTLLIGDRTILGEAGFDEEKAAEEKFAINEEKLNIVVSTIFRKAQNEHVYCKFYSELTMKIIKLEMSARGLKGILNSDFRRAMLDYCRKKFMENFDSRQTEAEARALAEKEGKPFELEDFKERQHKHKHELKGNTLFIGELFLNTVLKDKIAKEILKMLLEESSLTSDTVEAGLLFIEKIGPMIERKI